MVFTKKKSAAVNSFTKGPDGKLYFSGENYRFTGDYKKFRGAVLSLSVLIGILWISGGCLPFPGLMNCFWVIIPYFIALLVSAGALLWASFRMLYYGERLRDYVYSATVVSVPGRAVAVMTCAGVSLVSCAVYVILNGFGNVFATLGLFAVIILCGVSAFFLRKTVLSSRWEKEGR